MRRASLIAGLIVLALGWLGPLPQLARGSFFAHMTLHMTVVAIASPLIALGLSHTRLDPVPLAEWLFSPIPISIADLIVVWAWHAPVLHHLARHSRAGLVLEQSMFLCCGLLLWLSAFGGNTANHYSRRAAGIVALLLTSMHMTFLGALLALAPRPLYHHTGETSSDSLVDQHLGGVLMLAVGGAAYLAGGLALALTLLRRTTLRNQKARL